VNFAEESEEWLEFELEHREEQQLKQAKVRAGIGIELGIGIGIAGDGVARPVGERKLCPSNSSMIVVQRDSGFHSDSDSDSDSDAGTVVCHRWPFRQPVWHKCLSFPRFLPQRRWSYIDGSSVIAAEVQLRKL